MQIQCKSQMDSIHLISDYNSGSTVFLTTTTVAVIFCGRLGKAELDAVALANSV